MGTTEKSISDLELATQALSDAKSAYERRIGEVKELSVEADGLAAQFAKSAMDTRRATKPSGPLLTKDEKLADHFAGQGLEADGDTWRLGAVIAGSVRPELKSKLSDAEQKSLAESLGSSGGFLVPPTQAPDVIDRLRNATKVVEAGARTLPMRSNEHVIPRLDTGVTGAWRAENAAVSEEDPVFGRIRLVAKTCAVLTKMSYELLEDISGREAYDAIERELEQAIGLKVDYAALRGSGTDAEPLGIRNASGVTIDELGAGNGATPSDYSDLLTAVSNIWTANGEPTAALMSSRTATTYYGLQDTDNNPLEAPEPVAALPFLVTNQIPDDLTVGASNDCSEIFIGDWSQLIIGFRPELGVRTQLMRERYAENMQVAIVAWIRADVAVAHPELFSITTGVRP